MDLSEEKKREYVKRILLSRMRLLLKYGFYGLLLMHMRFGLDENCPTAYTDSERIAFNPSFLERLSNPELDFVMMHEILHVVLRHCQRRGDREPMRDNIACDIVVNSNILYSCGMDLNSITIRGFGVQMHLAPDGKEGYEYTAEEVYQMLPPMSDQGKSINFPGGPKKRGGGGKRTANRGGWDDHTHWREKEEDDEDDENDVNDLWVKRFEDACEAVSIRDPDNHHGTMPLFAKRLWGELRRAQTDWRVILNDFVQEEICDYSFSPPDRRFDETPFFLPDYNEKEERPEDILFMIDTSGSMSDEMITAAYSEVKGAIDQFDGKLRGWLGFFDAGIIEPVPFENEEEFRLIHAAGGGGTSFKIIFEYVAQYMCDKKPACIIILTDGYAPFPDVKLTNGIPVLWLINNEDVTPPWGKIARIKV